MAVENAAAVHMETLTGKVALVTGGSRGIGLAIAKALAAEGVAVAVTGRDDSHLAEASAAIEAAGRGGVAALRADVRHYGEIGGAVKETVQRFGGLDFLVNNAGIGLFKPVSEMRPAEWAAVLDTNLTGVFHACHAAIPHLAARSGGFIINISSLAGKNPFADAAAYCASKAGLNAFTEALMQELRYQNIRVSYIMPGSVATGFSNGDPAKGADWKIAVEDVAEIVLDLLRHPARSLPSRIELRPSKPRK
jgi:NAD(P)-dependent dehydrogenase (short-subunit alcohol dehydrogenase family)